MRRRTVWASEETFRQAMASPKKQVKVYAMFPNDRSDCPCVPLVSEWTKRLAMATEKERLKLIEENSPIMCPRDKSKMQQFVIFCQKCGDAQGYVYATDDKLSDWCDFHYLQWTEKGEWRGCFTPHLSPITEELCFECCCGNDTRDFRANSKLPYSLAMTMEERNSVGRRFGHKDSSYVLRLAPTGGTI